MRVVPISFFFFFNDTATTEIYTLSLHDALPICGSELRRSGTGSREAVLLARESLGPGWKTVSSKQRKLVGNRTSGSEGMARQVDWTGRARAQARTRSRRGLGYESQGRELPSFR